MSTAAAVQPAMLAIPMVFLPVVDVAARSGIAPLVTMAAILITSVPFWASYQNIMDGDGRKHH